MYLSRDLLTSACISGRQFPVSCLSYLWHVWHVSIDVGRCLRGGWRKRMIFSWCPRVVLMENSIRFTWEDRCVCVCEWVCVWVRVRACWHQRSVEYDTTVTLLISLTLTRHERLKPILRRPLLTPILTRQADTNCDGTKLTRANWCMQNHATDTWVMAPLAPVQWHCWYLCNRQLTPV